MILLIATIGFTLTFDHMFSDKPRQTLKLDFLHQIKLITVLEASYLLKLAIVFFPVFILLLTRLVYRIKFSTGEKVLWLFVISAVLSCTAFASENHGTPDISQAIYNIAPPIVIIISLFSLVAILQSGIPGYTKSALFMMLGFFAFYNLFMDFKITSNYLEGQNVYSKKFIVECLNKVNNDTIESRSVNIILIDSSNLHSWYYDFYQKASFLGYSNKVMASLNISPFLLSERKYPLYFSNPDDYNNPIEKWLKKYSPRQSIFDGPLLLKYFAEHNIDYLDIAEGMKFPDGLNGHLTLISKDENTGEAFYKIAR